MGRVADIRDVKQGDIDDWVGWVLWYKAISCGIPDKYYEQRANNMRCV
jgi:hypothetical protein